MNGNHKDIQFTDIHFLVKTYASKKFCFTIKLPNVVYDMKSFWGFTKYKTK